MLKHLKSLPFVKLSMLTYRISHFTFAYIAKSDIFVENIQ